VSFFLFCKIKFKTKKERKGKERKGKERKGRTNPKNLKKWRTPIKQMRMLRILKYLDQIQEESNPKYDDLGLLLERMTALDINEDLSQFQSNFGFWTIFTKET